MVIIGVDVLRFFFEGMDLYVKTWLELVFPVCIIVLVIAISALANYSVSLIKILKIFGKEGSNSNFFYSNPTVLHQTSGG